MQTLADFLPPINSFLATLSRAFKFSFAFTFCTARFAFECFRAMGAERKHAFRQNPPRCKVMKNKHATLCINERVCNLVNFMHF